MQVLKKTTESKFINSSESESSVQFEFHGLLDYQKALDLQLFKHQQVVDQNKQGLVIGLEHPEVLTLGLRAQESHEVLEGCQLPIVKSSRGGLATIHSEGQLVIYPIINLKKNQIGVRELVHKLLLTTQDSFRAYGLETNLDTELVGLYTENGKIAFCGLQVKQGVSLHGLSINITNNLELFNQIIPCGIKKQKLDKLHHYNTNINTKDFFMQWQKSFGHIFNL